MSQQAAADVVVALPAFNEQDSLAAVIHDVRLAVPGAQVVVVDDGSTDGTAELARRCGAVTLQMPFNVGVGGAMRVAFLYAQRNGFDAVVQVDADGQHDPAQVPQILAALAQADVVVGSRFAGDAAWVSGSRRAVMRALAALLSRITGARLDDVTSGFRGANRRAIELFADHYPSEYLGDTVESLVLASRAGLSITQVPVQMRARQSGQASHGPVKSALFLGRAVLAVWVAVSRPKPKTPRMVS